jgi:hypothetical protein
MPSMVMSRNYVLRSTLGHAIEFVKDTPINVPPALVQEAMRFGADMVSAKDRAAAVEAMEDAPLPLAPETLVERSAKIRAAFTDLVSRNERGDFNAAGLPNLKPLSLLAGFNVDANERNSNWQAMLDEKAGAL